MPVALPWGQQDSIQVYGQQSLYIRASDYAYGVPAVPTLHLLHARKENHEPNNMESHLRKFPYVWEVLLKNARYFFAHLESIS